MLDNIGVKKRGIFYFVFVVGIKRGQYSVFLSWLTSAGNLIPRVIELHTVFVYNIEIKNTLQQLTIPLHPNTPVCTKCILKKTQTNALNSPF